MIKDFNNILTKLLFEYIQKSQNKIFAVFEYMNTKTSEVLTNEDNPLEFLVISKIKENEFLITDRLLNPESLYSIIIKEKFIKIIDQDNEKFKEVNLEKQKIVGNLNIVIIVELLETIIRGFDIYIFDKEKENNNLN